MNHNESENDSKDERAEQDYGTEWGRSSIYCPQCSGDCLTDGPLADGRELDLMVESWCEDCESLAALDATDIAPETGWIKITCDCGRVEVNTRVAPWPRNFEFDHEEECAVDSTERKNTIPSANEVSIPSSVDPDAPANTEGDNSEGFDD